MLTFNVRLFAQIDTFNYIFYIFNISSHDQVIDKIKFQISILLFDPAGLYLLFMAL